MTYQIIRIVGGLDGQESVVAEYPTEQEATMRIDEIESSPDSFVLEGKPCRYRLDIV
jgi:hypothetical protein